VVAWVDTKSIPWPDNKLDVDTVKLWDTEGHIVGVLETVPTWEQVKTSSVKVCFPKDNGEKQIVLEVAGDENKG